MRGLLFHRKLRKYLLAEDERLHCEGALFPFGGGRDRCVPLVNRSGLGFQNVEASSREWHRVRHVVSCLHDV